MRVERIEFSTPRETAAAIRDFVGAAAPAIDVEPIRAELRAGGDRALLALRERLDGVGPGAELRVPDAEMQRAHSSLEPDLRSALKLAAENIEAVARTELSDREPDLELAQGQRITLREVTVRSAGVYVPGGRAAYPSTVLMCCLPARMAGVERIALATPPRPDGTVDPSVLAACDLCEVSEVYAVGGAQAIFALAYGTETIEPAEVIVGPGNRWVQDAKRAVFGEVGIDTLAGPTELMVMVGHDTELDWAALDLCAQAEHGADSPLIAAAVEDAVLDELAGAVDELSGKRQSVTDAPLALVQVPDLADAVELANALAPEHLQLMSEDARALAGQIRTAGCVFVGASSATAFGDYAAGSNHVLPTAGAGHFSGPLGPGTFRRRIANVSLPGSAAAALSPAVEALARAEGLPVHGESARARR